LGGPRIAKEAGARNVALTVALAVCAREVVEMKIFKGEGGLPWVRG
jgi:hypothetical protein